jgi:DNA-binding transcriptional LysR family regulator
MELRHLRHFLAVAEELHFGRAAQRLGMAQPPLSQSIARLERELGVRLFDRARRRISLTRAGAAFLDDARAAVVHADAARAVAHAAGAGEAGEIRIGFVSAALYERLPGLLARLAAELPRVRPVLVEASTNDQLSALADGRIDLGFVHPPLGTGQPLRLVEYPPEPCIAAVPDDGGTGGVTLGRLSRLGLVLFPAAQGPVMHAAILDAFARAGLTVRIAQEATRTLAMLALVSAGLGAAILARPTRRVAFEGVRYAPITDATLPAFTLAAVARGGPQPALVRRVWQLLCEEAA